MDKVIIGLTGQSGAGKSTVSHLFERDGFFAINADRVSREVTTRPDVLKMLENNFGKSIILDDGTLNRRKLAGIVFSDKEKLQLLNSIMFPIVTKEIANKIEETDCRYFLLDAPQLFESGANKLCNKIVSVIAPREMLIERAMERDELSYEEAEKRLNSQYPEQFFIENSDFVINNSTTICDLINVTQATIKEVRSSL